jgi:3-deoxy-D-manno-octulosonate 8-phosphate phosphatase (KDO 8-P phosphatase)
VTAQSVDIDPKIARDIRLVVLDVDGVLTDGGIYVGARPGQAAIEFKRFDVQDGLAVKMLRWAGIDVAIVSGRVSEATAHRAEELGIDECHQDPDAKKLPIVKKLLDNRGFGWEQAAMVGDDLADLPVMQRVALPVAVSNAVPEVHAVSRWTTEANGGQGAVREFVRALLLARGDWNRLVQEYCDARSEG